MSASRLRSIRPAPSRSSTAIAVWTLARMPRRLCRPSPADDPPAPSRRACVRFRRSDWSAGAKPKRNVVASVSTAAKASMPASIPIGASAGRPTVARDARTRMPAQASPRPSAAPAAASTRLSVRSWRVSLPCPAPIEARTAISRCRPSARESSRFATLAQAMSIRNPTAPKTRTRARRAPPRTSSSTLTAKASKRMSFGYMPCSVSAFVTSFSSALARCAVAPGFSFAAP